MVILDRACNSGGRGKRGRPPRQGHSRSYPLPNMPPIGKIHSRIKYPLAALLSYPSIDRVEIFKINPIIP